MNKKTIGSLSSVIKNQNNYMINRAASLGKLAETLGESDYIWDRILVMIEQGESIPAIAQKVGLHRSTINDHLRRFYSEFYTQVKNTRKLSKTDIETIISRYTTSERTTTANLAEEFGVSTQRISQILQQAKVNRGRGNREYLGSWRTHQDRLFDGLKNWSK